MGIKKTILLVLPFMSYLKLLYRSILYPKISQLIISIWVDIFANINIKSLSECTDEPPSTRLFIAEPTAEIQQDKGKNLSLPLRRLNGSNYQCCHINGWHTETTRSTQHTQTHTQRFAGLSPDMSTGSSSFTVFMEVTSITRCSWCVSSCCRSSIIFAIFVMPNRKYIYILNSCARNMKDWGTVQLAIILHIQWGK